MGLTYRLSKKLNETNEEKTKILTEMKKQKIGKNNEKKVHHHHHHHRQH